MNTNSQHSRPQDQQIPPMPHNLKTKEQREMLLAEALPPGVFIKPENSNKKLGRPKNEIPKIRKHIYWTPLIYQKIEEEAEEFGVSTSEYVETLCVYARNVLKIGKKANKKKNDKNGS